MNGNGGFFRGTGGLLVLFGLLFLLGVGIVLYALSVMRGFGERIQQPAVSDY